MKEEPKKTLKTDDVDVTTSVCLQDLNQSVTLQSNNPKESMEYMTTLSMKLLKEMKNMEKM